MIWRCARVAIVALGLLGCVATDGSSKDSAAVASRTPAASPARAAVDTTRPDSAAAQQPPPASPSVGDRVVDAGGIGPIRLGQTLGEARRAVPGATFTRSSDGEGAILVSVELGGSGRIVLFADEESDDAIDWTKRISNIETFDSTFVTADGVRVGALVSDVEKIYGKVTEILLSEIESREYVTFERQPRGMEFRLDYSGDFPDGQRRTTKYHPGAKIFSISVQR